MRFIADFHIHSPYSRATSRDMVLENLNKWSQIKGLTVIGTGDFTHPVWFENLKEKLEESSSGLYQLKSRYSKDGIDDIPTGCRNLIRFILSAEISCIYRKNGRTRKVHHIILASSFNAASRINKSLSRIGNLSADGRPILGLDSKVLLQIALDASADTLVIPAHAWTPHFSVLGSNSGFDSLEECFDELTPYIYAIETGLSSDPPMNWRLAQLDHVALISNSDAHSPAKLAREANIFNTEISYQGIHEAIKSRDRKRFVGTIEYFPEEGKYHYDGHRDCKQRMRPEDTKQNKGLCPKCGRKVTVGVMHRVDDLADRTGKIVPANALPFRRYIPLTEILAGILNVGVNTKKVSAQYNKLIASLGSELSILGEVPLNGIKEAGFPELADAIDCVRNEKVYIEPGYDGEFGRIKICYGELDD